jgi:ribosomal protein S18 acetylase RimI-like enzyme
LNLDLRHPRIIVSFVTKLLTPETWPAFAELVERHGGVWGGCWCMEFHPDGKLRDAKRRERKECRVREGTTHAALVFDGTRCVGWCQFGSPDELPRIKHRNAYELVAAERPDWRITCFFVDKEYRGKGVSSIALAAALEQISALGGGVVESYPENVEGRTVSSSFLYNSRLGLFERQGFKRVAQLGKNHWMVTRAVASRPQI